MRCWVHAQPAHPNYYPDIHSHCYSACDADARSVTVAHPEPDSWPDGHTDSRTDSQPHGYTDLYSPAYSYSRSHSYSHSSPIPNGYTNTLTHSYTEANADANRHPKGQRLLQHGYPLVRLARTTGFFRGCRPP